MITGTRFLRVMVAVFFPAELADIAFPSRIASYAGRRAAAIFLTSVEQFFNGESPPALPQLRVWEEENVFYTFHCYAPHEFTHQRGVLQAAPMFYNRDMPYPCEAIERYRDYHRVARGREHHYPELSRMDIEYLRQYLSPVRAWLDAHPDKLLWCGEFGTIRHAKLEWRENWMRDMITILKEWDIPYCVWNYLSTPNDGNRFSLVDDDRREILSERLHRIIPGEG